MLSQTDSTSISGWLVVWFIALWWYGFFSTVVGALPLSVSWAGLPAWQVTLQFVPTVNVLVCAVAVGVLLLLVWGPQAPQLGTFIVPFPPPHPCEDTHVLCQQEQKYLGDMCCRTWGITVIGSLIKKKMGQTNWKLPWILNWLFTCDPLAQL